MDEALNTISQMKWRIRAYNTIECAKLKLAQDEIKDKPWFIDKQLKKSIMEVVGKALADCVMSNKEFENKKPGEVITFEKTTPWTYEQANWNAVILYNYFACKRNKQDYQTVINKIRDYYKTKFRNRGFSDKIDQVDKFIDIAVTVIGKYEKAFKCDRYNYIENFSPVYTYVDDSWFEVKKGEKIDKVRLYQFFDTKIDHYQEDGEGAEFISLVSPKFYYYDKVICLAGYHVRYSKTNEDKTLLPISKAKMAKYKDNMNEGIGNGSDREDLYDEYDEFEKAKKLEERLKKYRDKIFYGLVEVSPLYCD